MEIPLADAIQQLRDQLRNAILEGQDQDILFTPNSIDIELSVSFKAEAKGSTGFKILTFIEASAEGTATRESLHKIKLSLSVADRSGQPIKVRSGNLPVGLPRG